MCPIIHEILFIEDINEEYFSKTISYFQMRAYLGESLCANYENFPSASFVVSHILCFRLHTSTQSTEIKLHSV